MTHKAKDVILWPRDRAALFVYAQNFLVILTVLVCAIMLGTQNIAELGSRVPLDIGIGSQVDIIQPPTKFRYVWFGLRENVSVLYPSPEKEIPVNVRLRSDFRGESATEIYTKNAFFWFRLWANTGCGLWGNVGALKSTHLSLELLLSGFAWKVLDAKGTNGINSGSCATVFKIGSELPIMFIKIVRAGKSACFYLVERNKGSLDRFQRLSINSVRLAHYLPLSFSVYGVEDGRDHDDACKKGRDPFRNWNFKGLVPISIHGWFLLIFGLGCCLLGCLCIQFWAYFGIAKGWTICLKRVFVGFLLICISVWCIHYGLDLIDGESNNYEHETEIC